MTSLLIGSALFLASGVLFWRFLPRPGRPRWFVGTHWEPYVAIAFTAGAGFGMALVLSAVVGWLG
jgi:hypothetical protein